MDQIYIPKNREGFDIGNYVLITPLSSENIHSKAGLKPFFYNLMSIEPIKLRIINEIFGLIAKKIKDYDNIMVTGSFLEKGFCFNDIDILLITDKKINLGLIRESLEKSIGIKVHLIVIDNKSLLKGLSSDPLYQMMISRFISLKRAVYNIKPKINYKLLDLHLLKSKVLLDNFDLLSGDEKFHHTRNLVSIYLFIKNKKVSAQIVNDKIKELFKLDGINDLKINQLNKKDYLGKYKTLYDEVFDIIINEIKKQDGAKQK